MRSAGHELGSHLYRHRSALNAGLAGIGRDIALNDRFLQEVAGPEFRAESFAYPYGEASVSAKWRARRRFSSARGVRPGLNRKLSDQDLLRVLPADNAHVAGANWTTILESVARERAWGIVLAHGVDDSGHDYSCPPDRLEAILKAARAANVCILPVGEVMRRIAKASP